VLARQLVVMLLTVSRISLGGACSAGESCLADNAECLGGRCQCRPGFYSVAGDCGTYLLTYLLTHLLIVYELPGTFRRFEPKLILAAKLIV